MFPANDTVIGSATSADPAVAVTVTCGFQPRYVRVFNDDAGGTPAVYEWYYGMTAGSANKITTAVLTEQTDGITVSASGFTIDAACLTATKKYYYVAVR